MGTTFEVADHVGLTVLDGVVYVAKLPDGPFFTMNDTAAVVWEECLTRSPVPLLERVAAVLEVDHTELAPTIEQLLEALLDAQILRQV